MIKKIIIYLILIFLILVTIIPIFSLFITSMKSIGDLGNKFWSIPEENKIIENFRYVWGRQTGGMKNYIKNSFMITLPTVFLVIFLSLLAAYPLARYNIKLNNFILGFVVFSITVPHLAMAIPIFKMVNFFHMYDRIYGLIFVHVGFGIPFALFLFRNYMIKIPIEILEASKIDGCSDFQTFIRIIVPLCKPVIAVMSILEFTWVFNEFFYGLVLTSEKARPATVAVSLLKSAMFGSHWEYQSAAAILLSLPTLIVFLCFQRYFIKGIMMGSVKG